MSLPPTHAQRLFCNRTLNLRSIQAIGYDMDYTLIQYHTAAWERAAFEHLKQRLLDHGVPVQDATFNPQSVTRGLIIDRTLGNIVKANRFGYIKAACHGISMLSWSEKKSAYARTIIDLSKPRWVFLNTAFSISEGCMYRFLVDLFDRGQLPSIPDYNALYDLCRIHLNAAHVEGLLKRQILTSPEHYVDIDPDAPLALLDQARAGKKLVLITNSGWPYTQAMMTHAYDPFLPEGMTWRDLFTLIIVHARKPAFFQESGLAFEVIDEQPTPSPQDPLPDTLLKPARGPLQPGRAYFGANADLVEQALQLKGSDILYVGDHVYSDVQISKSIRRWRTALILRELEDDIHATAPFQPKTQQLNDLMVQKAQLEDSLNTLLLHAQRARLSYGPTPPLSLPELESNIQSTRDALTQLDEHITPLAIASSTLSTPQWGLLMRAGNDKSYLARQVERHADIYMTRVSSFLHATPYAYIRSARGSLPHDHDPTQLNPFHSDGDTDTDTFE